MPAKGFNRMICLGTLLGRSRDMSHVPYPLSVISIGFPCTNSFCPKCSHSDCRRIATEQRPASKLAASKSTFVHCFNAAATSCRLGLVPRSLQVPSVKWGNKSCTRTRPSLASYGPPIRRNGNGKALPLILRKYSERNSTSACR